jgi:hypothetical protein
MLCGSAGGATGGLGVHRNLTLSPSRMLYTGMLSGFVPSASHRHSRTTVLTACNDHHDVKNKERCQIMLVAI